MAPRPWRHNEYQIRRTSFSHFPSDSRYDADGETVIVRLLRDDRLVGPRPWSHYNTRRDGCHRRRRLEKVQTVFTRMGTEGGSVIDVVIRGNV